MLYAFKMRQMLGQMQFIHLGIYKSNLSFKNRQIIHTLCMYLQILIYRSMNVCKGSLHLIAELSFKIIHFYYNSIIVIGFN